MEEESLLTVKEVAEWLNIRYKTGPRAGQLNTKAVYALPIRKTKVGDRVRYQKTDVRFYLNFRAAA